MIVMAFLQILLKQTEENDLIRLSEFVTISISIFEVSIKTFAKLLASGWKAVVCMDDEPRKWPRCWNKEEVILLPPIIYW